jgi:chromosome segregation ATPase
MSEQVSQAESLAQRFENESHQWNMKEQKLTSMLAEQQTHSQSLLMEIDELRAVQSSDSQNQIARMTELEAEKQSLLDELHTQQMYRDELKEKRSELQAMSMENEEILVQFGLLKHQMDSSEELVAELKKEIERLQQGAPSSENLQLVVAEKDQLVIKLTKELDEVKESLSMSMNQLAMAEKIDNTVNACEEAVNDLESTESRSHVTDFIARYEQRMEEMQSELEAKEAALTAKSDLANRLQASVSWLQSQLSLHDSQSPSHHIFTLNTVNDCEDTTGKVNALETDSLKAQLEVLTQELHAAREQLAHKEEELSHPIMPSIEDSDTVNDVHSLRSHIVSLAIALERSETKRAESIGKLIAEREASAESLRRLSESVKRFYSSVIYSDT